MKIDYDRLEWELSNLVNMGVEDVTMMQLVELQKHMALKSESLAPLERVIRIAISELHREVILKEEK